MTDTMYELPSMENVVKCVITKEAVLDGAKPQLIFGEPASLPQPERLPEPIENTLIDDAPTAG